MIQAVVAFSTRRPWTVILSALVCALGGGLAWRALERDAIPDVSNPQIVLVADWMGHPAPEVAESVTQPMTRALEGVVGLSAVRGSSMAGMAYVDAVFDASSDLERGRRAMVERIAGVKLPPNVRLQIGPLASSTGWVFQYVLIDPHRRQSAVALRRLQEDVLRPALAGIPGVAEVATVGGGVQQVLVELEAERLYERGVAFTDVVSAIGPALEATPAPGLKDIEALAVGPASGISSAGARPTVGDVGHVHVTDDMPTGFADYRGIQPAVGGIVVARRLTPISRG